MADWRVDRVELGHPRRGDGVALGGGMSDMDGTADEADEELCGRPCDPDHHNLCCVDYWQRMVAEGYWNERRHEWTAKGMKEITK